MKKIVLFSFLIVYLFNINAVKGQSLYFPPTTGATWDTLSPTSLGWCTSYVDTLYDYLYTKNTKAFLVLKDGKIVLEKYFDTFTKDSLWYWASAGKSLTAFMVGLAKQDNALNLTDTTSHYIGTGWTSLSPTQEEKITLWHQLTMTSGLDESIQADCTDDTCLQYLADPGTRWAYHNAPYTLLDSVIESATGNNLTNYVINKLYSQTGIIGAYIKSGYNNVFYSKPRAMARFGLLCLNKGKWNSTTIMSDTAYFNQMINTSQNLNQSYGYLWWLNGKSSFMLPSTQLVFPGSLLASAPSDMYAAMGKNGQILNVVPSQNLIVVRMGNNPDNSLVPTTFVDTMWQHLNQVICTSSSIQNNDSFEKITLYPNPSSTNITIRGILGEFSVSILSQEGKLFEKMANQSTISLASYAPGVYFLRIENKQHESKIFTFIKQ